MSQDFCALDEDFIMNNPRGKPAKFRELHAGHEGVMVRSRQDGMGQYWFSFQCKTCEYYEAEWE